MVVLIGDAIDHFGHWQFVRGEVEGLGMLIAQREPVEAHLRTRSHQQTENILAIVVDGGDWQLKGPRLLCGQGESIAWQSARGDHRGGGLQRAEHGAIEQ